MLKFMVTDQLGGRIKARVAAGLLICCCIFLPAYARALDAPNISDEFEMDMPQPMSAPEEQRFKDAAYNGEIVFAVWEDERDGVFTDAIYGARLTPDGRILDPYGMQISLPMARNPSIATDGDGFLVVWSQSEGYETDYDIVAMRFDHLGSALDDEPIVVCSNENGQYETALVYGNGGYLALWTDYRNDAAGYDRDIYAARISISGQVLDPDGFIVAHSTAIDMYPSLGFDGTNYLAAWLQSPSGSGTRSLIYTRISAAGAVMDTPAVIVAEGSNLGSSKIAFDGANYLIAWNATGGSSGGIYAARITPQGQLLDPEGIFVSLGPGSRTLGGVIFDGESYSIVYSSGEYSGDPHNTYLHYATRVATDGSVIDFDGSLIDIDTTSWPRYPVLVDSNEMVFWSKSGNVYERRFDSNWEAIDGRKQCVNTAANTQMWPAVEYGDGKYLVAWEDGRDQDVLEDNVYGVLVDADHPVERQAGIPISYSIYKQMFPDISFNGESFLVSWEHIKTSYAWFDHAYGARVSTSGEVLDLNGLALWADNEDQDYPVLAFDGVNHLLVWEDRDEPDEGVFAVRVDASGQAIDSEPIAVKEETTDGYLQWYPAVEYCNGVYLVVWNQETSLTSYKIVGKRVDPAGTLLDDEELAISMSILWDNQVPSIACDGENFMVAWQSRVYGYDIHGARVGSDGSVIDSPELVISNAEKDQIAPVIAFDGENFVAVWEDYRNYENDHWSYAWRSDIFGTRISRGGEVLDPDGIAISLGDSQQEYPALDCGPENCLVAYVSQGISDGSNTKRIRGRILNMNNGATTTTTTTMTTTTTIPSDDDGDDDANDDMDDDNDDLDDDQMNDDLSPDDDPPASSDSGDDDDSDGPCGL